MQLRSGIVTLSQDLSSVQWLSRTDVPGNVKQELHCSKQTLQPSTTKHVTDDDDATVPASAAAQFLVRARSVTSLAMAVAAMVARQMREQRRGEPDDTWTQEQVDLFELQRLSKATFKVEE